MLLIVVADLVFAVVRDIRAHALTNFASSFDRTPLLSSRHHLSYDDCLEDKGENY